LQSKDIEVLFVGLLAQPRYMMERIDIIPDLISEDRIYEHFEDCLEWVKNNVEDTV
jgi:SulP family sulfate permease